MKNVCGVLAGLLVAGTVNAAVVEQVIVRQQWPWSTDVKIEYKISGVNGHTPVNINLTAYNGGVLLDSSKIAASVKGDLYGVVTDGIGEIILDPVKAFGQSQVALANFKVKIELVEAPESQDVFYKIFDLEKLDEDGHFPCIDVTRADLLNGKYGAVEYDYSKIVGSYVPNSMDDCIIWTGVTNYPGAATTKLIMRKIPAGGKTWIMGRDKVDNFSTYGNAYRPHPVTLSSDYYIGVFEVTQAQYTRLIRKDYSGSFFKGEDRPVESISYDSLRGLIKNEMSVYSNCDMDLPTEAQWEYACRACTTNTYELYHTRWLSSDNLQSVGWFAKNSFNQSAGTNITYSVGKKMPNAFGLYDMIGNVCEGCLDYFAQSNAPGYVDGSAVVDPVQGLEGSDIGQYVVRGGSYCSSNIYNTWAGRTQHDGKFQADGFRLCINLPKK